VRALAQERGLPATLIVSPADPGRGVYEATWVLVSTVGQASRPVQSRRFLWTDDYSNLFQVLR